MSKKWILISLTVVILLPVMLLIIGVVVLNTTDLKEHRDTIAEHISQATGRQLSLNGELELNISTISSIVVTDIALANASWASEPEMLTIKRVEARIMLLPLLTGNIQIPHFHLEGVKALAETNASGISNWMLAKAVDDEVVADDADTTGAMKLPWIGEMNIVDVELNYHDGQTGKKIKSRLDHARIGASDKNAQTVIDIVGKVNNNPLEIHGQLALPADLAKSGVEVPIELQASVLDFKASVSGLITGTTDAPVADLTLQANAKNLNKLRQVFGEAVPAISKINFNAKLNSNKSKLKLSTMALELGEGRIDGWFTLDT
ncbi:MAG: AsmA family protein, partial [Gammaproteobacteria bacterium]|nr:AsmA family protein [Gammaproteobacteria bacterium]NNJ50550.1 AsmA family protein [Gammaproteobacteria bacterium]